MKKIHIHIVMLLMLGLGVWSCTDDAPGIEPLVVPTNLEFNADVSQDGSGLVTFTASANDAITYHFYPGLDDNETPTISQDGKLTYFYKQTGTYSPRVEAYGSGAVSTDKSIEIFVEVDFVPPADIISTLTNDASQRWIWKKEVPAHLGVGPELNDDGTTADDPSWYQAVPFEKESEGCLYDDVITFTLNPDQTVSMTLENNGNTYFHVDEAADALGVPKPNADRCYDYDTPGAKPVGFFETATNINGSTDVGMEINGGFMSYFLNSTTYEILSISEEELHLRTVQDIDGFKRAWYQKFQTEESSPCFKEPKNYQLIWSDEFNTDGAPSAANWSYNIGTGANGWGNQESQYYTNRSDNVIVENGSLKIIAKKENFQGSAYTSARLVTEGKFEFTYGKIEFRAKLPSVGGTWPAAWMLGADYQTNTWPACGEIDVMEHIGNDPGVVAGSLHSPSSFGATVNSGSTLVTNPFSEWHVYSAEWTENSIEFYLDGVSYYKYCPGTYDNNNYPFRKEFFIILNLAMGGTFGGAIDPGFTEDVYEIDYVRVYQ